MGAWYHKARARAFLSQDTDRGSYGKSALIHQAEYNLNRKKTTLTKNSNLSGGHPIVPLRYDCACVLVFQPCLCQDEWIIWASMHVSSAHEWAILKYVVLSWSLHSGLRYFFSTYGHWYLGAWGPFFTPELEKWSCLSQHVWSSVLLFPSRHTKYWSASRSPARKENLVTPVYVLKVPETEDQYCRVVYMYQSKYSNIYNFKNVVRCNC